MNSMKYFNKEINLAKKDNDLPRFNKAWEDLETWRDGQLYIEMVELQFTADEDVYGKKKKEYDDAWALGLRCLDYVFDRAVNGLGID